MGGAERVGTEVSFDVNNLMLPGKGIRGILEGESVPDIFIPQLIELNAQGRFPFEKLVKFYSLDQINQAAKDSENGGMRKHKTCLRAKWRTFCFFPQEKAPCKCGSATTILSVPPADRI